MPSAVSHSRTLSRCQALIAAHGEQHTKMMMGLCRSVGFTQAADLMQSGLGALTPGTVLYILVHYEMGDEAKRKLIEAIRGAPDFNICFAPIILFLPDGPYEDVLKYVEMGFDDVVCLPEKRDILHARLEHQLISEQIYIQTPTYIGPDRRRMELPGASHPQRTGTHQFGKITIKRIPGAGIKVTSRQTIIRGRALEAGARR